MTTPGTKPKDPKCLRTVSDPVMAVILALSPVLNIARGMFTLSNFASLG